MTLLTLEKAKDWATEFLEREVRNYDLINKNPELVRRRLNKADSGF